MGEADEQSAVRDLIGRANSQTEWRRSHAEEILGAVATLLGDWEGLIASVDDLAALHNPDQVAGGERHLADQPGNFADFVGPAIVNSALGATWGLPEIGKDADAPPVATTLETRVTTRYPEEAWPHRRLQRGELGERGEPGRGLINSRRFSERRTSADRHRRLRPARCPSAGGTGC